MDALSNDFEAMDTPARPYIDIEALVIEDDTPVDNLISEKQQRLLTAPLYESWKPGIPFLAAANVGLFYAINRDPLVPDAFLSLGVQVNPDFSKKQNRSYFFWEFGKPPEAVIEIVSNRKGNERGSKLIDYARLRIQYYVIYDPLGMLGGPVLEVFELRGLHYESSESTWLEAVGLGLTLWEGVFEQAEGTWLRWCDHNGQPIPTGGERAEQERKRAEQERERAEQERERAEQERERAERLAAYLRAQGVDPTTL